MKKIYDSKQWLTWALANWISLMRLLNSLQCGKHVWPMGIVQKYQHAVKKGQRKRRWMPSFSRLGLAKFRKCIDLRHVKVGSVLLVFESFLIGYWSTDFRNFEYLYKTKFKIQKKVDRVSVALLHFNKLISWSRNGIF